MDLVCSETSQEHHYSKILTIKEEGELSSIHQAYNKLLQNLTNQFSAEHLEIFNSWKGLTILWTIGIWSYVACKQAITLRNILRLGLILFVLWIFTLPTSCHSQTGARKQSLTYKPPTHLTCSHKNKSLILSISLHCFDRLWWPSTKTKQLELYRSTNAHGYLDVWLN